VEIKNIDSASRLYQHLLQNGSAGLIMLFGDDSYILNSMAKAVERYYTEQGGSNIIRLNSDFTGWSDIETNICNFDIFSQSKMIILSNANLTKLKELAGHDKELADSLGSEKKLLVLGGHLKKETLKTAWFSKLKAIPNYIIQFYPPEISRLPRWLVEEAGYLGLSLDIKAAVLLAESYEGNTGGAVQTLNTIKMQGKKHISDGDVIPFLSQSTRFATFDISDAMLSGDSYRSLKILHSLETQGEDIPLLLSEINRMLTLIMRLKQSRETGEQPQALFKSYNVFILSKQNQYQNSAQRMTVPHLNNLLRLFALINRTRMNFDNSQTVRYLELLIAFFSRPDDLERILEGISASDL
jgi:DNA polymerase-3 subunit delta